MRMEQATRTGVDNNLTIPRSNALRFHLRQQTAEAHARLDAAVGEFDSRESYGRYLHALLAFREPIETALGRATLPDDFKPRDIAQAIRADMIDLGIDPPGDTQPAARTSLNTPSAVLGTLYVLEGSALGARLLYKRAQELGFTAGFGARHLAQQAGDRESWPKFLALLERHPSSESEATARASIAAFELALDAFCVLESETR